MANDDIAVLHVDDDTEFLNYADSAFQSVDEAIEITGVTSAADGLAKLFESHLEFDCVISDYDMPEMDGLEFLATVRAEFSHLPLILMTGKGSEAVASRAFSIGVTDYIQKSGGLTQFELLCNRLEHYIEAAEARARLDSIEHELAYWKEFAPAAVVIEPTGAIAAASLTSREVFGADELNDLLGIDIWELVHPDEVEELKSVIEEVRRRESEVICRGRTLVDFNGGTTETTVQWRPVNYGGEDSLLAVMNNFDYDTSNLVSRS